MNKSTVIFFAAHALAYLPPHFAPKVPDIFEPQLPKPEPSKHDLARLEAAKLKRERKLKTKQSND